MRQPVGITEHDALLVIDVQNDFLPGGALAVPDGDAVIAPLNRCLALFAAKNQPIFASRDWHPADHCSFTGQGGSWPVHCLAGSEGARFAAALALPEQAIIISKAFRPERDSYSAFGETELDALCRQKGIRRLLVGGLATDYCVKNSVLDALRLGYEAVVIREAIRAVELRPGDGMRAEEEMRAAGAVFVSVPDILR
ncbi:MAG: bifunctional nicotinamidase/pyrazinamidase [Deltaproteobacteria bacterium]|nr:bifunctional nicotinamidase/pyrazinamidase [Deltaproteobacteria bacterium]